MRGTDANNGQPLSGIAHLMQSVRDILTTPLGSRVMLRDYGSRNFELIDQPMNAGWLLDNYAYAAEALTTWEPRLSVTQIKISSFDDNGRPIIDIYGTYKPDGTAVKLEGIVIS